MAMVDPVPRANERERSAFLRVCRWMCVFLVLRMGVRGVGV